MSLSAVLAELDGTGVPLCYLLLGINSSKPESTSTPAGATTCILRQFLQPLKDYGFNPAFFGCDKDKAEISAIRLVWPNTKIQLCFWHAKRAIRNKLQDSGKTHTQKRYFPEEAKLLVPTLEICWGSNPTCRPDGEHRYNRCQCLSTTTEFDQLGRLETANVAERNTVLQMFSRHFNMHSMIPDKNGTYRDKEQIHIDCLNELYAWCYSRNYFRLWAYLFVNWYAPDQWQLWARSVNPDFLPVLKTTMIIESHWRRIKHDYLHRFNCPRIDLVSWVLVSRVVPQILERTKAILENDQRIGTAPWRKIFKKEWRNLRSQDVDSQSLAKYHTDPTKWTCACESFLTSRFLICKHILCCYEDIQNPVTFFSRIRRQRYRPFWIEQQLVLRPQYLRIADPVLQDSEQESGDESDTMEYRLRDMEEDSEEPDESEVETPEAIGTRIKSTLASVKDLVNEQVGIGNIKFLQKVEEANSKNVTLVDEIEHRKNQRTMPKTWIPNRHAATIYYKPLDRAS